MAQTIPTNIPQIGPATLAVLRSHGISTNINILYIAFPYHIRPFGDNQSALCKIPGIGVGREALLREWASSIPLNSQEIESIRSYRAEEEAQRRRIEEDAQRRRKEMEEDAQRRRKAMEEEQARKAALAAEDARRAAEAVKTALRWLRKAALVIVPILVVAQIIDQIGSSSGDQVGQGQAPLEEAAAPPEPAPEPMSVPLEVGTDSFLPESDPDVAMMGAPITGQTVEIRMIGDGEGYRFEPAEVTIRQGDGVKFIMTSGGPHNVAFEAAGLSAEAKAQLLLNMPEQTGELSGRILLDADETYLISFAGMPAGTYEFHCLPHRLMNMKGKIIVE